MVNPSCGQTGPSSASSLEQLRARRAAEFSELQSQFEATGEGTVVLRQRTARVDSIVQQLYARELSAALSDGESASGGSKGICLVAAGGYGRAELFPFSDLDLIFVARDERLLKEKQESVASMVRALWDLQMRVFHVGRTVEDCGRLHRGNFEFTISLLDIRYVAGDRALFDELRSRTIPRLIARDGHDLSRWLLEHAAARCAKHGDTVFHLEPDVKDAPGGLRDYHLARWLARLAGSGGSADAEPEGATSPVMRRDVESAVQFLSAVRCFLHFRRGRNDNLLTYELQEEAAHRGLGLRFGEPVEPARWMREYYRNVRSIHRCAARVAEDLRPERSSLYQAFEDWRSRLSNADFSVIRGRILPRSQRPEDWATLLSLFEMMARHSLALSREAERWAEDGLAALMPGGARFGKTGAAPAAVWRSLRKILGLPNAAGALRAMNGLGVLQVVLPEFGALDSLVIRDFYHRYTVDEHTFTAIQKLNELKLSAAGGGRDGGQTLEPWLTKFSEIYLELDRPEVLAFALLLHDIGKGRAAPSHVDGSVDAARAICARLGLDAADAESVFFLIANHLEISSTVMRRDIFDPEVVRAVAEKVAASERLKMLCLMTYADISAVNPEAMTPWKAEAIWQLCAGTENYLTHSVDHDRLAADGEEADQIIPATEGGRGELEAFLSGFPRRYLAAHSPSEVGEHFAWARAIAQKPVMVNVRRREPYNEIIVMAADRPYLFASVSGTLAAWGMNILKAEAFSNGSGIALDVFRFHDLHRTLELNPSEIARLEEAVEQVIAGKVSVATLMRGRISPRAAPRAKVSIPTHVTFDDASSSRSTILELVAEDRPGLLYEVSSALADLGCNIEVALVETEGHKAIDVFYLTAQGAKLSPELQQTVRAALLEKLARR